MCHVTWVFHKILLVKLSHQMITATIFLTPQNNQNLKNCVIFKTIDESPEHGYPINDAERKSTGE